MDIKCRAIEFCDFSAGSSILDIGCGLGATQNLLTEYGFRTFGIDISRLQLCQCDSGSHARIQANGETVPIADKSLDGIFIECTLSVVPQPRMILSEVCRLLKPGGLLILTDLYARNIYGIPPLKSVIAHGCFNSIWSQAEVTKMVQSNGLESLLWEDHSAAIRNIVGKIILNLGSMDSFWQSQFTRDKSLSVDALSFQLLLARAKIGYFLLIAQKPDTK